MYWRTGYPTMPEPEAHAVAPEPISRFALLGNFLPVLLIATIVAVSLALAERLPGRVAIFVGQP